MIALINNKRVLALVTARSGSKGLPNKNIRNLGGRPLLAWPILAAMGSSYVDKVILSTNSEAYAEIGKSYGANVPFLRPNNLANDKASSIDVVIHALDYLSERGEDYDYILLLEPTSPLTEASDIDSAILSLDSTLGKAGSAVGVSLMETQHPAFSVEISKNRFISPLIAGSFDSMPRRQDLKPIYALDGSLYLSSVEVLYRQKSFCHDKTLGIIFDRYKSFEVDDLVDFLFIEAVLEYRIKNGLPIAKSGENL